MKIYLPPIDKTFDCGKEKCCSIVVENQDVFCQILTDLMQQTEGVEGEAVLSENDKVIPFSKHAEVISQFIPFDMSPKSLMTKITGRMCDMAVDESFYMRTNALLAEWEKYLMSISMEMTGNFEFQKITAESLIKSAGVQVEDLYDSLGEKILDHFELVQAYDRKKLFVLVNLRSFMSDQETELFLENVLEREIEIFMLESSEHMLLTKEQRTIVDADRCILC